MSWLGFFVIFSGLMTGAFLMVAYHARVMRRDRDVALYDLRETERIARSLHGDLSKTKLSLKNSCEMLELVLNEDSYSREKEQTNGRGSINVVNRRTEGGQAPALRPYSARPARNAGRTLRSRSIQVRRSSVA